MMYTIIEKKRPCWNIDDIKSANDEKLQHNEEINPCLIPVIQKTSIRFFKQFSAAMHSGKMYTCHLFCYSHCVNNIVFCACAGCTEAGKRSFKSQF